MTISEEPGKVMNNLSKFLERDVDLPFLNNFIDDLKFHGEFISDCGTTYAEERILSITGISITL